MEVTSKNVEEDSQRNGKQPNVPHAYVKTGRQLCSEVREEEVTFLINVYNVTLNAE
jgi:hypothetical protein